MISQTAFFDRCEPVPFSGCWLWGLSVDSDGYGQAWNGSRIEKAHRLSFRIFRGDIPAGLAVLHRCDVRSCVNPDHLFAGTQADNVRDMHKKGRASKKRAKGDDHGRARLSSADVSAIRASTLSRREIADKYGINVSHVHRIRAGIQWAHIKESQA